MYACDSHEGFNDNLRNAQKTLDYCAKFSKYSDKNTVKNLRRLGKHRRDR